MEAKEGGPVLFRAHEKSLQVWKEERVSLFFDVCQEINLKWDRKVHLLRFWVSQNISSDHKFTFAGTRLSLAHQPQYLFSIN